MLSGSHISVLYISEERELPPPSSPAVGGRLKPGGRDRGAETTDITRDKKTLNELLALESLINSFVLLLLNNSFPKIIFLFFFVFVNVKP